MASNLEILTPVWESLSPQWTEQVPPLSQENMANIGTIIASENMRDFRNEIYETLINLIAVQKLWTNSFTNTFSRFKAGEIVAGDTIQEMATDIIEAHRFQIAEEDQFEKFQNHVVATYHKPNREEYYPVTIEETHIVRAFKTEGAAQNLLNLILSQATGTNNIHEEIWAKKSIGMYYTNTEIPILSTQIQEVPPLLDNLMNHYDAQAFANIVKGISNQMKRPRRDYNPFGLMRETNPSEMVLWIKEDLLSAREIQGLTDHWKTLGYDLPYEIFPFDTLSVEPGDGMEDVYGIIADKQFFRYYDLLRTMRRADNARNLYFNHFYHVHQLYMTSAIASVVFLVKGDPLVKVPLDVHQVP